jgi:molybdate transport system ATP-binding protein
MSFDIDVTARLGERRICFQCRTGAGITAIVGPSGSGKTSALNMIAGLLRPDQGHVSVGGLPLFDSDRRIDLPAAARRAGYVFQDRRLFPHMRVRANLRYGRHGAPPVDEAVLIDLLGIGGLMDRWPSTLSGGEAQRVAIGRAVLSGPRFLLLDEPLASLDEGRSAQIRTTIARLRDELRLPILLVSHDRADVDQLADYVITLPDGRMSLAQPPTRPIVSPG